MTHWFSKFSQYLIAVIDGAAPRATLSRARLSEWTRSKHVHLNHTHTPWRINNSTQCEWVTTVKDELEQRLVTL